MKYCDKCKVKVRTDKDYCPLCFGELEEKEKSNEELIYKNKVKEDKTTKNRSFLTKFFIFCSLCAIVICGFINFIANKEVMWSLIVLFGILYVWVLIRHTIMSRRALFEKVLFQFLGIFFILYFSNKVSGSGDWFWNYVLPSISILTSVTLTILCFSLNKKNDHLVTFFILFILLLVLSLVLILTKIDTFKLLNQINLIYNGLTILGILILAAKQLKNSFIKTFNL